VGAAALAALLGVGAVFMVYRSAGLLSDARHWERLTPAEARRQAFGPAYMEAVEAIRRQLPEDAWYLIFPPEDFEETGWAVWLRHDLAPRRPFLVERRVRHRLFAANGAIAPKRARWAVMAGDGGVPVLLTREEALARMRGRDGR
jgi:hypothetical protein